MGAVKLCGHSQAATPYYVEMSGINLYSREELAYFLNENIYLVDKNLLQDKLFDWIEREAGYPKLAQKLRSGADSGISFYNQVLAILQASGYYSEEEIGKTSEKIKRLSNYQEQERMKLKADELFENGNYWAAVSEYEKIVGIRQNLKLEVSFYAKVWNNMACCYTRLFLFEKAAACFETAYEFDRDSENKRKALLSRMLMARSAVQKDEVTAAGIEGEAEEDSEKELAKLEMRCRGGESLENPEKRLKEWEKKYCRASSF